MYEQEMSQEGKFELGLSPLLKIILSLVIEHEVDYLTQGFQLELYADYETAFILWNLSYLYELQATNKESCFRLFMDDLVWAWKLEYDGDEKCEFRKRRQKLNQQQKKIVDDFYINKALASAFYGLALIYELGLKTSYFNNPLQGDIERHTLDNRIRKLKLITYPTCMNYEKYK